jgi:outer membrane protein
MTDSRSGKHSAMTLRVGAIRLAEPMIVSGGRRRRFSVMAAIALIISLAGCSYLDRQPEVNPDRWAPQGVDRPWRPAADTRHEYQLTPAIAAPAQMPAQSFRSPSQTYDLSELIAIALQNNPSTRQAWLSARAAAAAFGASRAPYYPMAGFTNNGGYTRFQFQAPYNVDVVRQWDSIPLLQLTYTLLDFGRRSATAEAAREQLAAANFLFNRKIQDVVFSTQRAFYSLAATKAAVEAARKNVELAKTDVEAVSQRLDLGLATEPALLLARQRSAQSGYDLENAKVLVRDAQADLAVALGVAADTPMEVENLNNQPIPHSLDTTVEQLIARAVHQRPDLAAQVANLRQSEAELHRANAAWYPTVSLSASYGEDLWSFNFNAAPDVHTAVPEYSTLVNLRWDLFTGLRRLNDVRQAAAQRDAAQAQVQSSAIDTIAQVWRAYFEFKSALKKYDYAKAILAASQDAYDANLEAYRQGLSTIVELLSAGNDLANARYTLIQSKADLLTASAAVAYAAGAVEAPSQP